MAKKKKLVPVNKPYLKGNVFDNRTALTVGKIFIMYLVQTLLYLVLSLLMLSENMIIRVAMSVLTLGASYVIFFNSGTSAGTIDVAFAENQYSRKERGGSVSAADEARGYHPAKGFVNAMLALIPFLIVALILAVTAKVQSTSLGALPSWLSAYEGTDTTRALSYYNVTHAMTAEEICRVIIRVCLMPFVAIIGSDHVDALLIMERVSALLLMVPGLVYGFGYTKGVEVRGMVHADIERGNRKRAKKMKKKNNTVRSAQKGPEQLN